jgi:hypothetical protein
MKSGEDDPRFIEFSKHMEIQKKLLADDLKKNFEEDSEDFWTYLSLLNGRVELLEQSILLLLRHIE